MTSKQEYGFISGGIPNVSPREALELCNKGAVIIDIRHSYITAFKKFDVKNVVYFPLKSVPFSMKSLCPETVYIVAESTTSVHSREIVQKMIENGFKKVYNMAGGFVEWERDNLPVVFDNSARLSGPCPCQLKHRG